MPPHPSEKKWCSCVVSQFYADETISACCLVLQMELGGLSICVGPSVTIVSHAKTAELIEMPVGLLIRVFPRNHVLDGGPDHPIWKGNFEGGKGWPIVKGTLWRDLCKNSRTDRDAVWHMDSGEPKEGCIIWGAHWRHLANATESSVCSGDAALCQITLTSWYY